MTQKAHLLDLIESASDIKSFHLLDLFSISSLIPALSLHSWL